MSAIWGDDCPGYSRSSAARCPIFMYTHNSKRIFVIGDDPLNTDLICRALQYADLPYELALTFDESTLTQKISIIQPYLIILDNSHVPDKSGFQYCQKIRRFFPHGKGQILFVGWYVSKANQDKILSLGKTDILPKPFVPKDLLSKIQFHLNFYEDAKP